MIGSGDQLPGRRPAGFELSARSIAPATTSHGGDLRQTPTAISDPILPLINLSSVFQKMDSLRRFLSDSVNSNASINEEQIQFVSSEISSAVHHIIFNGAALIASSHPPIMNPDPKGSQRDLVAPISPSDLRPTASMDPLGSGVFPNGRDPADPEGSHHGRRSDLPSNPIQSQIAGKVANPVAPICGRDPADSLFYVNPDPKGSQPSSSIFLRDMAAPISKKKSDLSVDPGLTAVMDPSGSLFSAKTSEDRDPADPKGSRHGLGSDLSDPMAEDDEIVEIDAIELMADHVHLCEICGKGFKRDANLRMHMRAHGNQFKTLEALSKPDSDLPSIRTRFSCPFAGCSRNRAHKRFQPLKSAACVKNHFKRSHCPKLYSCNRCREKRFAVVADLKSHLKHCGEKRWRCSCGTSFSRKDKLFGHVALFEGHSPAVVDESGGPGGQAFEEGLDDEFFEGLAEEIGGIGGVFG